MKEIYITSRDIKLLQALNDIAEQEYLIEVTFAGYSIVDNGGKILETDNFENKELSIALLEKIREVSQIEIDAKVEGES
jgi:hypothetical protein